MNNFEPTTESGKKVEAQETHEAPRSIEKSAEEISSQMMEQSRKEVAEFQQEGVSELEARAEKDGLSINDKDKEELEGLNNEAIIAREELEYNVSENVEQKNNTEEFELKAGVFLKQFEEGYSSYADRNSAVNNLLEAYMNGESSFADLIKNEKTSFAAMEVGRMLMFNETENARDEERMGKKEKNCRLCGAVILNSAKFCNECGNEIPGNATETVMHEVIKSLNDIDTQLDESRLLETDNEEEKNKKRRFKNNSFYVISSALKSLNAADRIKADIYLGKHLDDLNELRKLHTTPDAYGGSTDHVSEYTFSNIIANTKNRDLLKKVLAISESDPYKKEVNVNYEELLSKDYPPYLQERKRDVAKFLAEKNGLDGGIVEKWAKAKESRGKNENGDDIYIESYKQNIDAVMRLEKMRPGAAKELYEKFGIANFNRYREEMLIHQLDVENDNLPYGVVVFPEADWNGAFFQDKSMLEDARKQLLDGGYEMRVIETGSQLGMARKMNKFHQKYEPAGHKMSFIFLAGHGSQSSVQLGVNENVLPEIDTGPPPIESQFKSKMEYDEAFGKWRSNLEDTIEGRKKSSSDPRQTIMAEDLKDGGGSGIRRASEKWFDENVPVVFVSCSTGVENGIADVTARELGFTTTGPDRPTNVKKVDVKFDQQGKPIFNVEYRELEKYGKAETMKYSSSKKAE